MSHNKFHSNDPDIQRIIDGLNRGAIPKWTKRQLITLRFEYGKEASETVPGTADYIIPDEEFIRKYLIPGLGIDATLIYGEQDAKELVNDVVLRGIYKGLIPPDTGVGGVVDERGRPSLTEHDRMTLNVYHAAKKNLFTRSRIPITPSPGIPYDPELGAIGLLVDESQSIIDRYPGSPLFEERTKDFTRAINESGYLDRQQWRMMWDSGKGTDEERAALAAWLVATQSQQHEVETQSLHPDMGAGDFYDQSVKILDENRELHEQGVSITGTGRSDLGIQLFSEFLAQTEAGTRIGAAAREKQGRAISDPKSTVEDAFASLGEARTAEEITDEVRRAAYKAHTASAIGAIKDYIAEARMDRGETDESIASAVLGIADDYAGQLSAVMGKAVADKSLQKRIDDQAALKTDKDKALALRKNLLFRAGIPEGSITEEHKQRVLSMIQSGVSQQDISAFLDSAKVPWQEETRSRALVARKPGTDTGPLALEILNSLGIVSPFATDREKAFYAPAEEQIRTAFQIAGEGDPSIYQAGAQAFAEDVFDPIDPFTPGYGIAPAGGLAPRPWVPDTLLPGQEPPFPEQAEPLIQDAESLHFQQAGDVFRRPTEHESGVFGLSDPRSEVGQEVLRQHFDPSAPPSMPGIEPVWEMINGRRVNVAAPPPFPTQA